MKNTLDSRPTNNFNDVNEKFYQEVIEDQDLQDKTILDLGCGYGWFCLIAQNRGAKKIYGVEISEEDLKTAKKYINSEKIDFKIGNALSIPLPDESVDSIFSWEVIEHIPENTEHLMFKEINRVLKPGGKFYLSTPYNSFLSKLVDPAYIVLKHRHYDEKHFEEFIKSTKLQINKIHLVGRYWYLIDVINLYFSKWILRREKLFELFILKKRLEEFLNKNKKGFMAIYITFRKSDIKEIKL